ncbi:hypothetical protein [Candidatus Halobonum tyrrellensis]|uniref:Uncharacterized protein n=1 Tax=Candidatus Halobonum tyrrellensis G22 TaxID=1324957 RepID=V4HLY5_9EURY|nr:hypothetical protein [Candidatus Halobonum tyrrellensis]ESP88929.1 hypothetical protein K933_06583 [Candidatus Halobonum tyrrellensis G22]
MSAMDGRAEPSGLEQFPEFDLSYLLDDGESPGAVTVYDPDAPDARWVSADVSGAVPLEQLR